MKEKTISENDLFIHEMLNSNDWKERYVVARLGFHLDKLKNDPDEDIRCEVAYQGAYLDELKSDPDEEVRYVARQKLKELKEQETGDTDEQ